MIRLTRHVAEPIAVLVCWVGSAYGSPTIQNVTPPGLQIGKPTIVTISGSELLDGSELVINAPLASQTVKQASGNRPPRVLDFSQQQGIALPVRPLTTENR
jgi:hypothetical protein